MRTFICFAALAVVGVAQAETPPAMKAAPVAVEPKSFEVKTFVPKSIELATPSFEMRTSDVGGAKLDRMLAGKKPKAASSDESVMRAPSMPAIMEAGQASADAPAETPATTPTAAPAQPNKGAPHTR